MAKSKAAAATTSTSKKEKGGKREKASSAGGGDSSAAGKKRGWDEIEDLFDSKKKSDKKHVKQNAAAQERDDKDHLRRRKIHVQERKADEIAAQKNIQSTDTWVDDGLGGRFNGEGFTGRVEDGCKIFKAHVLSKPNAGQTPQCPFDCDCCYI